MKVTPYIESIVQEAGWFKGRQIEVAFMLDELKEFGYLIQSECLVDLFKEFWNINIEYITPDRHYGNIRLNLDTSSEIDPESMAFYSEIIASKLVPVGEIDGQSGLLLATEACAFYLLAQGRLFLLGDGFSEMLLTIVYRRELIEVSFKDT